LVSANIELAQSTPDELVDVSHQLISLVNQGEDGSVVEGIAVPVAQRPSGGLVETSQKFVVPPF
jgi:hypothetical protein